MLEINLLPKEYQKRKFRLSLEKNAIYVVGAGVGVLVLLGAYSFLFQIMPVQKIGKQIITYQQEEANFKPQIAKIDSLNELKQRIVTRMTAIDILDRNRDIWIDICTDIGSRISDYLWLTEFKQLVAEAPATAKPVSSEEGEARPAQPQKGPALGPIVPELKKATIKGRSFSLNSIATLIVRLKKSPHFKNIELTSIKLIEDQTAEAYEFVINSNLMLSKTEKAGIEDPAGGGLAGSMTAGSQF